MTPDAIIRASAAIHGIPVDALVGHSRERKFTPARQTAAFLLDDTGMRYSAIARNLKRSHGSSASALIDSLEVSMTPERQSQLDAARIVAAIFAACEDDE